MKKTIIYIITVILSISIGVCGTLFTLDYIKEDKQEPIVSTINIEEENTLKTSINKIYDAVVVVQTYDKNNKLISTGTGFVYKKDTKYGYIITNHHVIDDAVSIKIVNTNSEIIEAKKIQSDEFSDIAVLSINKDKVLKVAEIGDNSKMNIGDTVFAVGTPMGIKYMGTVTKGILSGKDRKVTVSLSNGKFIMDVLQTDTAINPGNSGGPLLNINGQVIGVTSLKLVEDEIEGMGFALPIEIVMSTVSHLEKGEQVVRPLFGAQFLDASEKNKLSSYNIDINDKITNGTVIVKVEKDTPADKAGLQKGDVILELNDEKITDTSHFRYSLYKYSVGQTIKIKYYRNNVEKEVKVKLTANLNN